MRVLWVIVKNTIRQGLRKKFLVVLVAACFLILCLSLVFAQLSLDDKGRLTTDFGLASVQILLAVLSVFFGASFIGADLERKVLWTILTGPVRPSLFFCGRWLGLSSLLFLGWLALSSMLLLFFVFLKIPISLVFFYAIWGFLLESLLLLTFVLFFASYVQPFLVLFYCLSIFIIGHFLESLFYFVKETKGALHSILLSILYSLPNLESVNWKSSVIYRDSIAFLEVAGLSLYMILWIGLVLSAALFIMEKREYG